VRVVRNSSSSSNIDGGYSDEIWMTFTLYQVHQASRRPGLSTGIILESRKKREKRGRKKDVEKEEKGTRERKDPAVGM